MSTPAVRPPNPGSNWFNFFGAFCAVMSYLYCRDQEIGSAVGALIVVAAYGLPILLLEVVFLRTPWRASVGLDFSRRDTVPHRIAVKLIGLYGSFGFVALLYWLAPEYHGRFYSNFWEALRLIGPAILLLGVPYMVFMDERQRDPYDSYYYFGKCLLLDCKGVKGALIGQHLLGWLVKAFFLPLMFVSFAQNINYLHNADFSEYFTDFKRFFRLSVDIMFTFDLLSAVAGYTLAIRLFDTHIRSSEPTVFGWLICTMCYQPFLSVYMRYYLTYSNNDWQRWLDGSPFWTAVWGSMALFTLLVYTLASLNFGCRFSNLTHRGVLTKGMYRFTKHPAYVGKNLFWWFTYVPFVPMVGWLDSLRYCLLLLGINTVYYLRARTEENHLSRDPAYVQYALYMNEHSLFRRLARCLPFLQYKAPAGWEKLPAPYMGIKG